MDMIPLFFRKGRKRYPLGGRKVFADAKVCVSIPMIFNLTHLNGSWKIRLSLCVNDDIENYRILNALFEPEHIFHNSSNRDVPRDKQALHCLQTLSSNALENKLGRIYPHFPLFLLSGGPLQQVLLFSLITWKCIALTTIFLPDEPLQSSSFRLRHNLPKTLKRQKLVVSIIETRHHNL